MGNVFIVCTFNIDVMHRTKHQEVLFKAYLLQRIVVKTRTQRETGTQASTLIYQCILDVCLGYMFNIFIHQKHEKLHTGEKNFKCEHCNKSFAESTGLKIHLETHNLARDKSCDQVFKGLGQWKMI